MSAIKGKNAVIWGFSSKSTSQCIRMLEEKEVLNVDVWVGYAPESTHDMISFFEGRFKKEKYFGEVPNIYSEVFNASIHTFMEMMSRHSFYAEKSFHDHANMFSMLVDLFSHLLVENHIDIVLFQNLPHEGPDFVLYKIAKKLNIKTILFYQSIFPNRFFYVFDIDDFGIFSRVDSISTNLYLNIENKFEKSLPYMNNVNRHKYGIFSLQRNSSWILFISLAMEIFSKKSYYRIQKFFQRSTKFGNSMSSNLKPTSHNRTLENKHLLLPYNSFFMIKDTLLRLRSVFVRFFQRHFNHRVACKNLSSIISHDTGLENEFVYFPLHLQPELTTSILGGLYVDQLLAIERLSKIIPQNWYIYIKENPKQTELMRGSWFFERLRIMENVKVVPLNFDTYTLIKKCKFVATITGTAGWEAISGGKNALVFGNPWYKSLPGIFSYDDEFKVEDILNYDIDHNYLERELNHLLSKTCEGVIDEAYATLVKDFDPGKNASDLTTYIEKIIGGCL